MQNRASAIGGQLNIHSDIENGTTIQLQIPV